MATWHALSPTQHENMGWTPLTDFSFVAQDAVVPVVYLELAHLLPYYALGFVHHQIDDNNTRMDLMAILSLLPQKNVFLDADQKWKVDYVPAILRGHPFRLVPTDNDQLTLCFDVDSPLFNNYVQPNGNAFFNKDKSPSDALQQVINFLQTVQQNQQLTSHLVKQLADHNLIVPWDVEIKGDEGKKTPVKGLHHIDPEALRNLAPESLSELAKSGALNIAYAQMLSEVRLQNLEKLHREYTGAEEVDIESLFGEQDDTLKFNF